jgi:hypothetical protein
MQRQERLRLGDANTLRGSWARFTDDQRKQVIAIFAELIARATRGTEEGKKEHRDDAVGK